MSARVLSFLVLLILAFAGVALSAGVRVYERRINESEFTYNDGSARVRIRARPARVLHVPEE